MKKYLYLKKNSRNEQVILRHLHPMYQIITKHQMFEYDLIQV